MRLASCRLIPNIAALMRCYRPHRRTHGPRPIDSTTSKRLMLSAVRVGRAPCDWAREWKLSYIRHDITYLMTAALMRCDTFFWIPETTKGTHSPVVVTPHQSGYWQRWRESNPLRAVLETAALPMSYTDPYARYTVAPLFSQVTYFLALVCRYHMTKVVCGARAVVGRYIPRRLFHIASLALLP